MDFARLPIERRHPRDLRPGPVVFVVDDDVSVRESLELLIRSAGWQSETFESATAFLATPHADAPSCVIVDMSLPDLSGLELQRRIVDDWAGLPVIFITGYGDVATTVRAMKAGAVDFLTKPFDDTEMLSAIAGGIEMSRTTRGHAAVIREIRTRYESLSRREQQVMTLVVSGLLNKQIGGELGISEITVKAHRGKVMRKMKADSLADLVKMATLLGITLG